MQKHYKNCIKFAFFRCESIAVLYRFVELQQVPRFGPQGRIRLRGLRETRNWTPILTFVRNKFDLRVFLTCSQFCWSDDGSAASSISIAFMMNTQTFFHVQIREVFLVVKETFFLEGLQVSFRYFLSIYFLKIFLQSLSSFAAEFKIQVYCMRRWTLC